MGGIIHGQRLLSIGLSQVRTGLRQGLAMRRRPDVVFGKLSRDVKPKHPHGLSDRGDHVSWCCFCYPTWASCR